jgi:ADP-ribosylation factor 2-binding protein
MEDIIITSKDKQESKFDEIVGVLEDILMEEGFHSLMASFCDKYCEEFDDSEGNKLEYTIRFNEYTNLVEQYIQTRLRQYDPSFLMEEFLLLIRYCIH